MSVARAALLARPKTAVIFHVQRRLGSTDTHHHGEHHESSTEYPPEGFSGPFWRNATIFTLLSVGVVNFAPDGVFSGSSDAPWLTRVLAHYAQSKETWVGINARHLLQTEEDAKHRLFLQTAQRPAVHRYRNPLLFEQVSTHCVPVGGMADMRDLVVKGDKDN